MQRVESVIRLLIACAGLCALCAGCAGDERSTGPVLLGAFPLDAVDEVLEPAGVFDLDAEDSADGHGSLHVFSTDANLMKLVDIETPDFAGEVVKVSLAIRSMSLSGLTHLELWHFWGEDEARGQRLVIQGATRTTDWKTYEAEFEIPADETPDRIRLMMYLNGRGHVWIDDLKIFAAPAGERETE